MPARITKRKVQPRKRRLVIKPKKASRVDKTRKTAKRKRTLRWTIKQRIGNPFGFPESATLTNTFPFSSIYSPSTDSVNFREMLKRFPAEIINIEDQEVNCETGASSDFFTRRVFDEVQDIIATLDIIDKGTEYDLAKAFLNPPSENDSDYTNYVRHFLYELMVDHPSLYMLIKNVYGFLEYSEKEFLENIGKGNEWEYVERDDLGNIQVRDGYVKELLKDNNEFYNDVEIDYYNRIDSKYASTSRKRERWESPSFPIQSPVPVQSSPKLRAPRAEDDYNERVSLYNHLCFYLEPIHDFTSNRHKDEGETKVISSKYKDYLKKETGKFIKDDVYLKTFNDKLVLDKTKFNINGNVRDFSSTEELDTLLKTIDVLGKNKSSKTIKFTTKVTSVTGSTKGPVATFNNTKLSVEGLIKLLTSYFGNKRIFRDAKGTVLVKHLEESGSEIGKSGDFAEKLFDGNGPNKLKEDDTLYADYANQVFNAPDRIGKDNIIEHFRNRESDRRRSPYIITQPSITGVGDRIPRQVPKSFSLEDGTMLYKDKNKVIKGPKIEFGVSVKEMSMIMKYYMKKETSGETGSGKAKKAKTNTKRAKTDIDDELTNYEELTKYEEMFWVMLNLKRAGDHGQAERAKVSNGVFETLDHLAAAYALMIDAPTIFTYADSKKGIIGDFILTDIDLIVSEVLLVISTFLTTILTDESIESFADLIKDDLGEVYNYFNKREFLNITINSVRDEKDRLLKDRLLNYYDLCSTLIQFDKYINENKDSLIDLFKESIVKFQRVSESLRAKPDQSTSLKLILDVMMTKKNFTRYKNAIRTFTSLVIKLLSIIDKLGIDRNKIKELIENVYRKCLGIDEGVTRNTLEEYFKDIRNNIIDLLKPRFVDPYNDKPTWRSVIIEKLSFDSWLKDEDTRTIATNFTELINIYNNLYRVEPSSSSSSSPMDTEI